METVRRILATQGITGLEDMELNESYRVESEIFMDLSIEKIYDEKILVGHYYTERADLMADPELRFLIEDYTDSDYGWIPIEYRQDGVPNIYERDEMGLGSDVRAFVRNWDERLGKQGFIELAEEGSIERVDADSG